MTYQEDRFRLINDVVEVKLRRKGVKKPPRQQVVGIATALMEVSNGNLWSNAERNQEVFDRVQEQIAEFSSDKISPAEQLVDFAVRGKEIGKEVVHYFNEKYQSEVEKISNYHQQNDQ